MKPRFEPDPQTDLQTTSSQGFSPTLIDPEAYDASEQTFAASLEQTTSGSSMRFVVEETQPDCSGRNCRRQQTDGDSRGARCGGSRSRSRCRDRRNRSSPNHDPESWRREVAARLSHYRARRRPREPRYPSLQLKFESEPVRNILAGPAEPLSDASALQGQTVIHDDPESAPSASRSPHKIGRAGGPSSVDFCPQHRGHSQSH